MYSTFTRQPSRRRALTLRLDLGPLLELAQGVAHALEHGVLAAGHALALGCRQPQRVVAPALQDRVLLVGAEVLVRQHILRLTEHGTRIAQRSFLFGHRSSSERRSALGDAGLSGRARDGLRHTAEFGWRVLPARRPIGAPITAVSRDMLNP